MFYVQALFVVVDIDEKSNGRLLQFFDLKEDDCPVTRFIDITEGQVKYKPTWTDINSENIVNFVRDVLDGKVKVGDLLMWPAAEN